MNEPFLRVDNVVRSFRDSSGTLTVLDNVSFTLNAGELVSLVGVSGAGKTTLLQIVGGLDRPSMGMVHFHGRRLDRLTARELAAFRSENIGFVFQFHHLLPDFTALENVYIPGLILKKKRRDCVDRARELLDAVGVLPRSDHYPAQLSGGERQRVALARALFNRPALVLADEPTGNLDVENGKRLVDLFWKANREFNQSFVIATHNPGLAGALNRVLYLDRGRIKDQSE